MRRSGWKREPVPAKRKMGGRGSFATGLRRQSGCANPSQDGNETRRWRRIDGRDGGVRGGGRPYLQRRWCGEERDRRWRVVWATTLAKLIDFYLKPTEGRFERTMGGGLLSEARRAEATRKSARSVPASASGSQKPPRSWTKQGLGHREKRVSSLPRRAAITSSSKFEVLPNSSDNFDE
jgi:hypothetical protein